MRNRKQILLFITEFLSLSLKHKRCLQGCGRRLKPGQMHFCSDVCRHLYTIQTWGKGIPDGQGEPDTRSLRRNLQASLRLARKGGR